MQLRVAFHVMGGDDWTFGPVYLKNLFYALQQTCGNNLELCLVCPTNRKDIRTYARSIGADDIISYNIPPDWTPLWAADSLCRQLLSRDIMIEKVLREHKINAFFDCIIHYKYPKMATLSLLPDFQHMHLPEMFSEGERLFRDRTFLQSARFAARIVLLSNAVKKDFESFSPMYRHKARVLHPVTYVPKSIYNYDLSAILKLYHIPEKFVYLPNQFWKHKNHKLVFQAVKMLKDRGIEVFVVCTGNPSDERHPTHFASLFQKLSEWNIRGQVAYLGLFPHELVLLLMRQSICVVNPSLFEGWGYTVDEARSVGKQVLLSDIPAHREQDPPKAVFFDPYDCEGLAEKLGQIWKETIPGPDIQLESEARRDLPSRLNTYGEAFVSLIRRCYENI